MKYGFIYVWYDRKHKKYYVGRHWGTEDDGYICSSNNMRMNYKYRQEDFKRRVVSRVYTSVKDLIVEEQRWLDMIDPSQCGKKYYNKSLSSTSPSSLGYSHTEEAKQKIGNGNRNRKRSESFKKNLSQKLEEEHLRNPDRKVSFGNRVKELWNDPVWREKQLLRMKLPKGPRSEETRRKISEKMKERRNKS